MAEIYDFENSLHQPFPHPDLNSFWRGISVRVLPASFLSGCCLGSAYNLISGQTEFIGVGGNVLFAGTSSLLCGYFLYETFNFVRNYFSGSDPDDPDEAAIPQESPRVVDLVSRTVSIDDVLDKAA